MYKWQMITSPNEKSVYAYIMSEFPFWMVHNKILRESEAGNIMMTQLEIMQ